MYFLNKKHQIIESCLNFSLFKALKRIFIICLFILYRTSVKSLEVIYPQTIEIHRQIKQLQQQNYIRLEKKTYYSNLI